jgi:hypothetical protein
MKSVPGHTDEDIRTSGLAVLTKRIQGFHPSLFVCELEYFRKIGQRYDRDPRRRDERKSVANEPTVVTDKCNTHYTHTLFSLIKKRVYKEIFSFNLTIAYIFPFVKSFRICWKTMKFKITILY